MKRSCLLIYILFAACYQHLCAQQKEFLFKNFTQEEGLPSNEAYYIFEDSRHYIWIATDLGVVRYNGNKFEQFNLPDNVVFKIKEDYKGRIWFFGHKAKFAYLENEKIFPYKFNDVIAKNIKNIDITDAFVDDSENVIFNSSLYINYSISKKGEITEYNYKDWQGSYDTASFRVFEIKKDSYFTRKTRWAERSTQHLKISTDTKKNNHTYVFANQPGIYNHYGCTSINGNDIYLFYGKQIFKLNKDGSYSAKEMPGQVLCINSVNGKIWVGLRNAGAFVLNPDLTETENGNLLTDKTVTSIIKDFEDGLWFSTLENGVYYIKNANLLHYEINKKGNKNTFRLLNFQNAFFLCATPSGLYKIKDNTVDTLYKADIASAGSIFAGNNHDIFLTGTVAYNKGGDVLSIQDKDIKKLYLLYSPSETARINDTLIFDRVFGLSLLNTAFEKKGDKTSLKQAIIQAYLKFIPFKASKLFTGLNNTVWAATKDGLYKVNPEKNTVTKFKPGDSILERGISSINQMDNGILVAGIRFGGIVLIKEAGIFLNITEKEGLLSNKIRYILPIKDQLWVATAKGISVISFSSFNPVKYQITNIGRNDGFFNITINHLIQYKDAVVAATSNSIYYIENFEYLLKKKMPEIPFYINTITNNKWDTSNINSITLPYSANRIIIKYSAISFNSYETVKYLYRFDHTDTIWHSTTNTELLLENLEAGTYNLQIKAVMPSQQRESVIQEFSITVEKPWWQNNWLRLFLVTLIAGATYLYVKKRIKKIRLAETKKTELNAKLAELEQTALRSQMNPHFIFNCLTSIQQLIVSGNKTDANEYLVKFARLIRKTLELSMHPFISIREEVEYLNEYLFLEQLRLSGHFEYRIGTDKVTDIDKTYIPNMMIQPVVENCIRHGIKSLENRKGKIEIRFVKNETSITCIVTDNGIGRSDKSSFTENAFSKHKSYGMEIIRKRLQAYAEFNDEHSGIEIKDLYGEDGLACGTQVTLQLPFKKST